VNYFILAFLLLFIYICFLLFLFFLLLYLLFVLVLLLVFIIPLILSSSPPFLSFRFLIYLNYLERLPSVKSKTRHKSTHRHADLSHCCQVTSNVTLNFVRGSFPLQLVVKCYADKVTTCEVLCNRVNKRDKLLLSFKSLRKGFTMKLRTRILESVKMRCSLKL
jgi:energy-coupling factor transporter transmembrane protein EcfT